MKRYFYSLFLVSAALLSLNFSVRAQQSILDPNDPVSNYDENNPPSLPTQGGIMKKWVRTPKMGWNTSPYKAYFYSTSYHAGIAFRLLFPKTYGTDPDKKYPMLVFFHGMGEISRNGPYDNELQLVNCGQKIMEEVLDGSFDGFVLFPQTTTQWWANFFPGVVGIINYMAENNQLDKNRIIISGLSMGGTAVWDFIKSYPKIAAGATPVSAATASDENITVVNALQSIPVWLSQGGRDQNPLPEVSEDLVNYLRSNGLNIRYTVYPNSGHGVWNNHYEEPDAFSWMLAVNKTNPHVYYGQTEFCAGQPISDTLSLTAGFEAYQWSRNGVTIPGATSNTLIVTDTGTYAARYKMDGKWTYWSPAPVKIIYKEFTQTPPIQISGLMSRVIPAPDGNNSVTLALPPGYTSYQWRNTSGQVVGTDSLFTATEPGSYVATVTELSGCPAKPSDSFYVAANSGPNPPDPISSLNGDAISQTKIQLNWSNRQNPVYNETAFEIYRGTTSGGPYNLVGIIPADTLHFEDEGLSPNTDYYYVIRATGKTGAAPISSEIEISTLVDAQAPLAPSNLKVKGSSPTSITLLWHSSKDNVTVKNYGVYMNGVRSYITTDTTFTLRNLTEGETYAFTVKAFDPTGNISPASNQVIATAVLTGLKYRFYSYDGGWSQLPDLNSLTPTDSGLIDNISLTPSTKSINYALSFQGNINIRQAGTYTFFTQSDDGSNLYINNIKIVNNDGLHGTQERSGSYSFDQPGSYPFRIDYYQEGGSAALTVSWKASSLDISKSLIPDSAFAEDIILEGDAPEKPVHVSAHTPSYDSVIINWEDNSIDETGFEIYRSTQSAGPFQIIYTTKKDSSSYVDTTVAPERTYYYKVQAINQYGSSGYDTENSYAQVTTPGLPPVPAPPSELTAIPVSAEKIELHWNDLANNETSFELFQSMRDTTSYRKIATLPVNSQSYVDSSLYGNTTYYYKIKAVNVGGTSGFSNLTSTTTFNHKPNLTIDSSYYIRYGQTSKIVITTSDKDNELLNLTVEGLPSFGSFQDNGDQTGTLTFSPSLSQQGDYQNIKILVNDQHGGRDSAIFSVTVGDIYPPEIQPVSLIHARTFIFTKDTIRLTSPSIGTDIFWEITDLPAFIDTTTTNSGYLILKIAAKEMDAGNYSFKATASNSYGMADEETINLNVAASPLQKWYLNFAEDIGYLAYPDTPWNNIRAGVTTDLLDDMEDSTHVGITFQTSWWNPTTTGAQTGDNSGVYPDNVLRDNYYFGREGGPEQVTAQITGLDPQKSYALTFFASSIWPFTNDNGHTIFQVGAQKDSIDVQGNTNQTLTFVNITPSVEGTISFTMHKGADAAAGYLNSLVISTLASIPPSTPIRLQLNNLAANGGNAVKVTWQPGSNNANTIEVYRSTNLNGNYTLLNDGVSNGNMSSYLDTSVAPTSSATYYYYLVAANAYGSSMTTDTLPITTNQYVDNRKWYLNFATSHGWMSFPSSPWNNIRSVATTNLQDNQGHNSNVGLTLQTDWWNPTTSGAQTGDNSGIYPDNVLRDNYYFGRQGGPEQVAGQITGLDPAKNYALTFFASSSWAFTNNNGHTVFRVGTQKDSIDVQGNTDRTLTISNLTPSEDGTISFIMSKGADAAAGYLNSLVISTLASNPPKTPTDVSLNNKVVNGSNAVEINWLLESNNANTVEVYRSTSKTGNYTLLNEAIPNGNKDSYLDTTVAPVSSVTYYYYLVAANAYGSSVATDTLSITTSQYIDNRKWYLNFATNYGWMSFPGNPWNNIRTVATTNLQDNQGHNGNVGLTLQTDWWNPTTSGAQTGDNSGVYPDNVLRDNYYFGRQGGPDQVTGQITGLDPGKNYALTFFASSIWAFTKDNGHTVFQVGPKKDSIDVQGNTDHALTFTNVMPSEDGTISFTMNKGIDAAAGYLNSLIISTQSNIPPVTPINLQLNNRQTERGNVVAVNWQPGSNNTDSIFIYRSLSNTKNYELLHLWTSETDSTTYLDTTVVPLHSGTYYYYLVAANNHGHSASSDTVSIVTSDLIPKTPINIQASKSIYNYKRAVNLVWESATNNADHIEVYRATTQNGYYTILNPATLNGDTTSYLDTTVTLDTEYYYYLVATNGYGSSDPSDTVSIMVPNTMPPLPPVITAIVDTELSAGNRDTLRVTTENPGENINFSLIHAPSFAILQNIGNGNANIILNPKQTDIGLYDSLTVIAVDYEGNRDTAYFSIQVTDGNLSLKMYLNFTKTGNNYSQPWNNIYYHAGTNISYNGLSNRYNQPTGLSLTAVNAWSGTQSDGADTYNNSGAVPDSVMATGFYISDNNSRTLKLSGLDTSKLYNLVFFASSNNGGNTNYITHYTVNGQTVSLNGIRNTSRTVRINGITPDTNGEVKITIARGSNATIGLLNAMMLEAFDKNALVSPANLMAIAETGKVDLKWTDRSDNETAFIVLRADALEGPYTQISSVAANTTNYSDPNVVANKRYFYKIVSINAAGDTMPGEVASVTTPAFMTYVNFNLKEDPAPAPWNNTQTPPQKGDVYGPLLDSHGNNTGITFNMISNFAQENSYGLNTENNSGVFPDLVILGTYYADNGIDTVEMKINHLNLAMKYDITFFASITGKGWVNTTQYIANGKMVALESSYNSTNTVTLKGLSPDMNGQITVKMIYTIESRYEVINAMIIRAYDDYDNQGNKIVNDNLLKRLMKNNYAIDKQNKIKDPTRSTFSLVEDIYPNPFSSLINIRLKSTRSGKALLLLYDINGKLIDRNTEAVYNGINSISYHPKAVLPSGLYILSIRLLGSDTVINRKVLKQ